MNKNAESMFCARLPPDLATAVLDYAEANGLSRTEVVRNAVYQFVYGEQQGPDQGFMTARAFAIKMAHASVDLAAASLPTDMSQLDEFFVRTSNFYAQRRRENGTDET